MIRSFGSDETQQLFERQPIRKFSGVLQKIALRKLLIIDAAVDIRDLRIPPGNHLELLKGKREGFYSIRVNGQWRICFRFQSGNAYEVEIVDYH